jgi:protein TonB
MSKPRLFPLTLGLSVCFHAVLLLFFSVKASISLASPVQAEREEAFSLVNIALTESAPPPRRAAPEAPSPPTAKPVQVSEDEPAEHYIEQDIEQVEESIASETEDKVDPAPVTEESAGYAGAPESAVVAAGGTAEKSSQSAEYIKRNYRYIQRRIRDKLVYPAPARKAGIQGVTELSFTIHEDGRVSAVRVLKSSGHVVLDEAAVDTIYAAAPFPKPPASARIAIPIAFRLR